MALFSGIAALAGMAGTWTLFGSATLFTLAKTAVGIGLNTLAARLSGRKASAPSFSVKGQLQRGADLPQSFLIGRCATAGSLVYANSWGKVGNAPNGWLTMVITLSDLPVQSLDGLWVDGQKCTFGDEHPDYGFSVNEYKEGNNQKDHLWIKFYDGSQTVADPYLVNTASNQQRPWEADAVGYGTAYAIVTARIDQDLFQGFPECLFELTGARLYDPSKDSTVGGTGPQRWSDPSTWGGDGDHLPAVQLYNLFRGLWWGGEWFYGMQATHAAQMPVAHWIDQIEKCRAPIAGADGPEPTYRAGGEISVGAPIAQAMDALLETCSGRVSEAGGLYKLFVGGLSAPVVSITDDDILSSEEQTFTPFFGLADTVNGVSGKFPDPAQVWQLESAPPLNNPDFEVEDGGRRLMVDVQYDLVPYSEQVQRLMQGGLNEARRARRHTFVLPPRFWALEAGDIVSFTSARNGYVAKLFRVDGVLDQSNADVLVDLTEVDPADYVFDTNTDYTPVTGGSVVAPVVPPQLIAGWSVTAAASTDAQGAGRFPAIAVGWDGDMDDVIAVEVRARVKATGAMIFSGRFEDVAAAAGLIVAGILPAETYEVQGRYVSGTARQTVWSDWLEVTTLDLRITRDQLQDEIGEAIDAAAYHAAQVGKEIDALLSGFAGGTLKGALDRQRKGLQAGIDGVSAKLSQDYLTAASINKAISSAKKDVVATSEQLGGGVFATGFFGDIWRRWSLGGSKRPGTFYPSGNLYEFTVSDVQNAGLQLWSEHAGWVGASGVDRYRLELEFELVSGATSGAGVLFDWRNTKNQLFRFAVPLSDFVSEPIQAGKRYFGSVLVERPAGFTGTFDRHSVYLMANYGGLGARTTKSIRFHKFQAYPATVTDARAAQHAAAISDLQGNASASVVFKVLAGAQSAELGLFAQDGDAGAVSLFRVRATNILLDGSVTSQQIDTVEFRSAGLAVFGGAVMSANFDGTVDAAGNLLTRGTQGFAITQKGDAVFTNLIARDDIQVGAVSEGVTYANDVAQTLSNNAEVLRVSLGEFMVGQFWQIACRVAWRSQGYTGYIDSDGRKRMRRWKTGAKLQWRRRAGTRWSGWSTLHTFSSTTSTRWRSDDFVIPKQGVYDEVELRIVVNSYLGTEQSGGNGGSASFTNFDEVSLVARALVR
ncbi:MAG: phage tail protein [Pseudomonadota bacterium]|nr:phage tail protein [Pseudomonadota bacterium]